LNLETFKKEVIPTLGKYKITEKGFYQKFRLQSIYKTEFPFNNEYERFFVIEDNVYKLSDSAISDVYHSFKGEKDINEIVFTKNDRTTFVNVPFERFILVNEQVTPNLIYAIPETKETSFKELLEGVDVLLTEKNKRYGNAINNRLNIFDGKCNGGQRLDEKLSRIKNSSELRLNDVVDIIGFLTLTIKEKGWSKQDILNLID
jgi:hypothetical protein